MNSIFKKVAIAGALALTLSVSAQAATTSLGVLSGTTTSSTATTSGSFNDLFNFSVTPNAGAALASQAITFASYGTTVSTLALYLGTYTSFAQLVGLTPIAASSGSVATNLGNGISSTSVSAKSLNVSAGQTYTLAVTGSSQGSSAYTTIVALAPVPEPETYAMLLAGLGVMGFVARRRQKNNQA